MPNIQQPYMLPQTWDIEVGPIPRMVEGENSSGAQIVGTEVGLGLTVSDGTGFKTMFMTVPAAEVLAKTLIERIRQAKTQGPIPKLVVANGKVTQEDAQDFLQKQKKMRGEGH